MGKQSEIKAGERTQHTPGPWYQMPQPDKSHFVIMAGDFASDDYTTILDCHVDQISLRDARLIAAAPELLEALILALPYVETAEHDDAYKPRVVVKMVKVMREAIAKAEGL